jgi:hypothetical protein
MSGFKRVIQRNQSKHAAANEKMRLHNANIIAQANALLQQAYQNGFMKALELSSAGAPTPNALPAEQPVEPGDYGKYTGGPKAQEQTPIG